jgi:hypothetical protein
MIDARFVAAPVDGVIHPGAELVKLIWTPLDAARKLNRPDITRQALADLAEALDHGLDKRRPRSFYRELRRERLREEL